MPIRTTIYIDGFNFYYGLKSAIYKLEKRWQRYYWIDFIKFGEQLIDTRREELTCVKYFTASPLDNDKEKRQSALFKANKFLNGNRFEIIKGKYYKKPIKCLATCKKTFQIHEEKRTDVNISVHMMGDCSLNRVDKIILISADSDLVPPIEFIKENYKHVVIEAYFPPCRTSHDIKKIVKNCQSLTFHRPKFEKAVMPDNQSFGGRVVDIPKEWIYTH